MTETEGLIKPEEVERLSDKEYMKLIKQLGAKIREKAVEYLEGTIITPVDDETIETITYFRRPKDGYERYLDLTCGGCRFERCCNEGYDPRPCDKMFDKWKIEINIKLIPPPSPSPQRCKDG